MVVYDSKAFTKPWDVVRRYRRAAAGSDGVRGNAGTESLRLTK
jgi:hypothetical protein